MYGSGGSPHRDPADGLSGPVGAHCIIPLYEGHDLLEQIRTIVTILAQSVTEELMIHPGRLGPIVSWRVSGVEEEALLASWQHDDHRRQRALDNPTPQVQVYVQLVSNVARAESPWMQEIQDRIRAFLRRIAWGKNHLQVHVAP